MDKKKRAQKVYNAKRKAGRALSKIIDEARRYIAAEDEFENQLRLQQKEAQK